jgi:O-antigen ligase
MHEIPAGRAIGPAPFYLTALLLALVFVTGGGSYDRGWGDVLCELLALPVLGLGIAQWLRAPRGAPWWLATATVLGLVLLLALYQTGLPAALVDTAGRRALDADLQSTGLRLAGRWSLSPVASERGAWSVLPALALFFATVASPARQQARLARLVVVLAAASMLLGFLQLGAPQQSPLNLFPEWPTVYGGFFASFNHQATALAIASLLAIALALDGGDRDAFHEPSRWSRAPWIALAATMLLSLPLTGSRAIIVLALGAVAALLLLRLHARRAQGRGRRTIIPSLALVTATGFLAVVGWQWLQVDRVEELRTHVATATLAAAQPLAPLGGGLGAFVPWFQQELPLQLRAHYFFNHAHNEYAQWWLEGGVAAMLVLLLALATLAIAGTRVLRPLLSPGARSRPPLRGAAALIAIVVVLAHSVVDYPMRTPALMAVTAVLAAFVVSQAGTGRAAPMRTPADHPSD